MKHRTVLHIVFMTKDLHTIKENLRSESENMGVDRMDDQLLLTKVTSNLDPLENQQQHEGNKMQQTTTTESVSKQTDRLFKMQE